MSLKINIFRLRMKLLTTFSLILLSMLVLAQSKENISTRKLYVGVSFSPDYSYRRLYSPDDDSFVDLRNEAESPRFGFTTGIVISYQISNRFVLESGILFSDKGDKYGFVIDDLISFDDFGNIITGRDINDPLIPEKHTSKYHYYFLGIPLKMNYYFLKKNVGLFMSIGVSTDYLIDAKHTSKSEFKDRTEKIIKPFNNADFNRVNIVGLVGFGIDYKITHRIKFQFEPVFRYSFTPLVNTSLKGYLYSFGVDFTVFFQ